MAKTGRKPQRWTLHGLTALHLALPSLAQDPKPGPAYEDKTDLGFSVKMPAKWESIPPAPDDGNLIIKYDPKSTKYVLLDADTKLDLHAWIVKFDRRKSDAPKAQEKGKDKSERMFVSKAKDLVEWMKQNVGTGFRAEGNKELEVAKVPAVETIFLHDGSNKQKTETGDDVRVYSMLYKIHPEVDVAVVFIAPGEDKKWNKYVNDFRAMAKSFKPIEVDYVKPVLAEGASMRDKKRAELQDTISRQSDWKLYETPNYFIVSSLDDKPFIEELKGRLEAIRAIYEQDYPAAKVAEIRAEAARVSTGGKPDRRPDEEGEGTTVAEPEPLDDLAKAMEASQCSIVRICKDRNQYHSYGGPEGSAGYWNSNARELVLYDDKAVGGRNNTWIVLNHEAFHQYIFYFYGNMAPHYWYNEGTGDFYSGYAYKNGRFTLKENPWRKELIQSAIQKDFFYPLKEMFRYGREDYYSREPIEGTPYDKADVCYAQGWSMVYFLRTGKKNNAKGWNPRWDTLLDDYLKVLAATGKPEQAIEQCLTGIDIDALQAAWIAYTK